MKIIELIENVSKYKFLNPKELKQSYTDAILQRMGFRKSSNGSWFILRSKWDALVSSGELRESASGYIPSEKEKNDPRYCMALTVDINPDSLKDNAKKLGLGKISRAGIPNTLRKDGKL